MNSSKTIIDQSKDWLAEAINFAQKDQFEDALRAIDKALLLNPPSLEAILNRALILEAMQRLDDALNCINQAINIYASLPEALSIKAAILYEKGDHLGSIENYKLLIDQRPNDPDPIYNQGVVYAALKEFEDARKCFAKVVSLSPSHNDAWVNLANAHHELQRYTDALEIFDRLIKAIPNDPQLHFNRANTLYKLNRFSESTNDYCFAFEHGLANDFELGISHHRMMLICDWSNYNLFCNAINKGVLQSRSAAEPFGYQGTADSELNLQLCAELFCKERFPSNHLPRKPSPKTKKQKISVGYLCGEFGYQATSILMTNIWELHDHSKFNIIGFDNAWSDKSNYRERIESSFDQLININRMSDLEAAKAIQDQGIDILVNLNGYFGRERQKVFAMKPSPIQINFLGFPGTIGAPYIDYIIADQNVIPEESRKFYTEKVIYLPNSYQPNDPKRIVSDRQFSRLELGLPEDQFIFCCFSNNYKITPYIFSLWMKILKSTPNSILWLLQDSEMAAENLRKEATKAGINPSRLHFASRMPLAEHLARHKLADLFLDTSPYSAHTTASDALWMNLPILTLTGKTFPGRVATSLLKTLDLQELVTEIPEDYIQAAIDFALNENKLNQVRAKLCANISSGPLFDAQLFTNHLECAYQEIYGRHHSGLSPGHLSIPIQHQ